MIYNNIQQQLQEKKQQKAFQKVAGITSSSHPQSTVQATKFASASGCSSACVYGGQPKREQLPAVRAGAPILVATPGRLNDFLEYKDSMGHRQRTPVEPFEQGWKIKNRSQHSQLFAGSLSFFWTSRVSTYVFSMFS